MNKNNKTSSREFQDQNHQTKTKFIQGKSQFTRSKLERDYQPKLKKFKHKLLKTSQYQKLVLQRIQNQHDQQKVTQSALQCFKNGQLINLDWKTRSNFRKSDIELKFPRINTQPLNIMLENSQMKKSTRTNFLQNSRFKSMKHKSIDSKCLKLQELLSAQNGQSKSFFKSSKTSQINESKLNGTKSMFFLQDDRKSMHSKDKNKILQNQSIFSSPIAGLSVNLSQILSKQNSKKLTKNDLNFENLRSQTEELQNITTFQLFQNNSQRKKQQKSQLQYLPSQQQVQKSEKNSNTKKQKILQQKETISTQKEKNKNYQGYDILNDPHMYLLIQKTRSKIINFKQTLSLKNMSKLEKIKYLSQKQTENQDCDDKIRSKSLSQSKVLKQSSLSQVKIVQKIEAKKRSISQKINKDVSRVFTEIEEYVKNAQIQQSKHYSQICSYLKLKNSDDETEQNKRKKVFDGRQGKIKRRKRQSLVEVQEKLLKQVKLSFLKQDLTKKFQQIRDYQQQHSGTSS